jgi:hypothetical protein
MPAIVSRVLKRQTVSVAPPGLSVLLDALDDATSGFSALLRRVEDGSVSAIGDWTIGDVAAHMTHGFTEVYPAIVRAMDPR